MEVRDSVQTVQQNMWRPLVREGGRPGGGGLRGGLGGLKRPRPHLSANSSIGYCKKKSTFSPNNNLFPNLQDPPPPWKSCIRAWVVCVRDVCEWCDCWTCVYDWGNHQNLNHFAAVHSLVPRRIHLPPPKKKTFCTANWLVLTESANHM